MEVREGCALAITETWLVQSMTANEGCSQPQLQTLPIATCYFTYATVGWVSYRGGAPWDSPPAIAPG